MLRKYFKITGRVQGIGYRCFVVDAAKSFAVTGWVRNAFDDSVEIEVQGSDSDLIEFENALKSGHSAALIKEINTQVLPVVNGEKKFDITY